MWQVTNVLWTVYCVQWGVGQPPNTPSLRSTGSPGMTSASQSCNSIQVLQRWWWGGWRQTAVLRHFQAKNWQFCVYQHLTFSVRDPLDLLEQIRTELPAKPCTNYFVSSDTNLGYVLPVFRPHYTTSSSGKFNGYNVYMFNLLTLSSVISHKICINAE